MTWYLQWIFFKVLRMIWNDKSVRAEQSQTRGLFYLGSTRKTSSQVLEESLREQMNCREKKGKERKREKERKPSLPLLKKKEGKLTRRRSSRALRFDTKRRLASRNFLKCNTSKTRHKQWIAVPWDYLGRSKLRGACRWKDCRET